MSSEAMGGTVSAQPLGSVPERRLHAQATPPRRHRHLASAMVIVVVSLGVLLPGLGQRDLWAPDEPRFAVIGHAMVESGDWVMPRMNGRDVALLPPLTYWLVAAASLPGGTVTETSARLGLVASAIATLLAVFVLGSRLGRSQRAGLAAAAVLGTCAQFLHQAQFLQADIHLLAGTTWALVLFHGGYTRPERRHVDYPLMGVAIAWAILAKGPVGAILPGLVVATFLLIRRDLRGGLLATGSFWLAVAVSSLIAVPWFVAACLRGGPEFSHELLLKHNFGMFFDTWSHSRPAWYYLVRLPQLFVPWTLFLPAAGWFLWQRPGQAAQRDRLFLVVWAATLLAFFSLSDAKQSKYILPLYPALAVAVGLLWAQLPRAASQLPRRLLAAPATLMAWLLVLGASGLVLLGGGLAASLVTLPARIQPIADALAWPVAALGALLVMAGGLAVHQARNRHHHRVLAVLFATMAVLAVMQQAVVSPLVNPEKSARALCRQLADHASPETPLGILGIGRRQHGGYLFYSRRPIVTFRGDDDRAKDELDRVSDYLRRPERVFVMARESTWQQVQASAAAPLAHELFRRHKGSKTLVVFSNQRKEMP